VNFGCGKDIFFIGIRTLCDFFTRGVRKRCKAWGVSQSECGSVECVSEKVSGVGCQLEEAELSAEPLLPLANICISDKHICRLLEVIRQTSEF